MVMIESVVVWKWSKPGYRTRYTAEHVNVMRNMVERHYPFPHRFICITDDPTGIDERVEVVKLWDEHKDIPNPTWPQNGPSCYRRLRAFSEDFADIAGKRFVSVDLDVVITGDLSPLWNRPEDFVIYDPLQRGYKYNGSMWLLTSGSRAKVWDTFHPHVSPMTANAQGHQGSDQGWIQYVLGPGEATWTVDDGVLGYKRDCRRNPRRLPGGARVVMFHGKPDPWDEAAFLVSPWIKDHWR